MMQHGFGYTLYLDGLPSATVMHGTKDYMSGIPIGRYEDGKIIVFNHLEITVFVHHTVEDHQRVVGLEVTPFSIAEGDKRQ